MPLHSYQRKLKKKTKTTQQPPQPPHPKSIDLDYDRRMLQMHTPFLIYYEEKIDEMIEKHPSINGITITQFLMLDWLMLSEQDKSRYEILQMMCTKNYLKQKRENMLKASGVSLENTQDIANFEQEVKVKIQTEEDRLALETKFSEEFKLMQIGARTKIEYQEPPLTIDKNSDPQIQINYCASDQCYFSQVKFLQQLIMDTYPKSQIECYPVHGQSQCVEVCIFDRSKTSYVLWSKHFDGMVTNLNKDQFTSRLVQYINDYN